MVGMWDGWVGWGCRGSARARPRGAGRSGGAGGGGPGASPASTSNGSPREAIAPAISLTSGASTAEPLGMRRPSPALFWLSMYAGYTTTRRSVTYISASACITGPLLPVGGRPAASGASLSLSRERSARRSVRVQAVVAAEVVHQHAPVPLWASSLLLVLDLGLGRALECQLVHSAEVPWGRGRGAG